MSPTVDMLSRTITQPKKLPDKKSDFLKQMKKDKQDKPSQQQQLSNGDLKTNGVAEGDNDGEEKVKEEEEEEEEAELVNGVNDLGVAGSNGRSRHSSDGSNIFSASSLELEQRYSG